MPALHHWHSSRKPRSRAGFHCCSQKCVDKGKEVNLNSMVSKDTITRGLRYAVATGNWGQQGTADLRAGVSQVLALPPHSGVPLYDCCRGN